MYSIRLGTPQAVFVLLGLFLAGTGRAQDGYVYYNHAPNSNYPGDAPRIEKYLLPGHTEPIPGLPQPMEIRQNSRACFTVVNPNPLLYSYAVTTQVLKAEEPEGLAKLVGSLKPLIDLAGVELPPAGVAMDPAIQGAKTYQDHVQRLGTLAIALDKERSKSDAQSDFAKTIEAMEAKIAEIDQTKKQAEASYEKLSDAQKKEEDIQVYRAVQQLYEARVKPIQEDVAAMASYATKPYQVCKVVGTDRVKVVLTAKRKVDPPKDAKTKRPVDTLATYEVVPRSIKRFRLAPSLLIAYPVGKGARSFAVEDSVVIEDPPETVFFAPVVAQFRAWDTPLWGTIGVNPRDFGGDLTVDLFMGLTFEFGMPLGGPSASLGAGVTVLQTPIRLIKGEVGQPLAPDVEKLDDVVKRKSMLGVGFTLTISSLKLTSD